MRAIGLQLYTIRRAFRRNPFAALERVRAIGYDAVEFAAPLDLDFAALGAHLRALGLDCPSAHVGLADLAGRPDAVLAMAEALRCRWLVLPYLDPAERDWTRVIAALSTFARRAAGEGLRVAYHHHDFEFEGEKGARPFDRLVAETDPSLIDFELDVYWLTKAGEDPVAAFRALAPRARLAHLKDMDADGAFADVGAGRLDFPAMIAAAETAGVTHFFVEHDNPPDPPWASVEASLRFLRALDRA